MIRYYTVTGDLENGYDFEYTFKYYKDAKKKYDSIKGVPFKVMYATDDKEGEIALEKEG